jgi:hypothetical protein
MAGEAPAQLAQALHNAVTPGGARIRPTIMLSVAMACGDDRPALSDAGAVALELIHCASLVHDDLPCFDDANTRRGKATVHKAFSEPLAVLTGDTLFNFATMPSSLGLVQGNRLRALAVSAESRTPILPAVPTVAEAADLPGFALSEWIGLYAPTGVPQPIMARIADAVKQSLAQPEVIRLLAGQGAEAAFLGLQDFAGFLAQQRELLSNLAERAGMKAE